MSSEDIGFLLESLAINDPCVRELAVRLLGQQEDSEVTAGLLRRLSSTDSAMRTIAAFGLSPTGQ